MEKEEVVPGRTPPAGYESPSPPGSTTLPSESEQPSQRPPTRSRLIVVEQIYVYIEGTQPTQLGGQYLRPLKDDEQLFTRWLYADKEWKSLDTGWVERAALVWIRNESGQHPIRIPTPEEKEQTSHLVLEIGFCPPPRKVENKNRTMWSEPLPKEPEPQAKILIPPGESARFAPSDLKDLSVRCRFGKCRYKVAVVPL